MIILDNKITEKKDKMKLMTVQKELQNNSITTRHHNWLTTFSIMFATRRYKVNVFDSVICNERLSELCKKLVTSWFI